MRVIMTAIGSLGDVYPVLSLGRAFRAAGHETLVVTSANFRAQVDAAGLGYVELFDAPTYDAVLRAFESLGDAPLRAPGREQRLALERFLEVVPGRLYRAIEALHLPEDSVLVSPSLFALGAPGLAARKLGLPYACVRYTAASHRLLHADLPFVLDLRYGLRDLMLRAVWFARRAASCYDTLRRELELPKGREGFSRAWSRGEQLNLCLFPGWFVGAKASSRSDTVYTGFPIDWPPVAERLPAGVEAFLAAGERPVLFSRASWRADEAAYFGACMNVCEALGIRGLLLAADPDAIRVDSASVMAVPRSLFDQLVGQARASVNHGGIGTLARAMAAGLPQVIVPRTSEQAFNARVLVSLGVARKAEAAHLESNLETVLRGLLDDASARSRASLLSARLPPGPDYAGAVAAVEGLVSRRHTAAAPARLFDSGDLS